MGPWEEEGNGKEYSQRNGNQSHAEIEFQTSHTNLPPGILWVSNALPWSGDRQASMIGPIPDTPPTQS